MWGEAKLICNFVFRRAASGSLQVPYFVFVSQAFCFAFFFYLSTASSSWLCCIVITLPPELFQTFCTFVHDTQFANVQSAKHTQDHITWCGCAGSSKSCCWCRFLSKPGSVVTTVPLFRLTNHPWSCGINDIMMTSLCDAIITIWKGKHQLIGSIYSMCANVLIFHPHLEFNHCWECLCEFSKSPAVYQVVYILKEISCLLVYKTFL